MLWKKYSSWTFIFSKVISNELFVLPFTNTISKQTPAMYDTSVQTFKTPAYYQQEIKSVIRYWLQWFIKLNFCAHKMFSFILQHTQAVE